MLGSLLEIGWGELADVGVVSLLLWALVAWARRVHASLALLGLAFLGVFYLLALQLELQLTAWFFQGFFAVVVILLVVVPGREPVERHLLGGIALDAAISEELLLSIFDPRSPGHDGAVLVQGDRLGRFAVLLPISEQHPHLGPGGTRHAAARGLAERCDALCVVVSEERGTVAVASAGELQVLENPDHLIDVLRGHLATLAPRSGLGPGREKWRQLWRRGLEAVAAFALALASWTVLVPGSTVDQVTLPVPVVVGSMPEGYVLDGVDPDVVEVKVAGPRRELLLASPEDFQLVIDNTSLVKLKRRTFAISGVDVRHPTALEILGVSPEKVRLSVREIR